IVYLHQCTIELLQTYVGFYPLSVFRNQFFLFSFFFFNDTATTEIYTLSLHDALPILQGVEFDNGDMYVDGHKAASDVRDGKECRSEERFSRNAETDLVCRLLLEKKKKYRQNDIPAVGKERGA